MWAFFTYWYPVNANVIWYSSIINYEVHLLYVHDIAGKVAGRLRWVRVYLSGYSISTAVVCNVHTYDTNSSTFSRCSSRSLKDQRYVCMILILLTKSRHHLLMLYRVPVQHGETDKFLYKQQCSTYHIYMHSSSTYFCCIKNMYVVCGM